MSSKDKDDSDSSSDSGISDTEDIVSPPQVE